MLKVSSKSPKKIGFWSNLFTSAKLKECLSTSANRNIYDVNAFIKRTFLRNLLLTEFLENSREYHNLYSEEYLTDFCANLVIYIESVRERHWFPRKISLSSKEITISFSTLKAGLTAILADPIKSFILTQGSQCSVFRTKYHWSASDELCRACDRISRYRWMYRLQNDPVFFWLESAAWTDQS